MTPGEKEEYERRNKFALKGVTNSFARGKIDGEGRIKKNPLDEKKGDLSPGWETAILTQRSKVYGVGQKITLREQNRKNQTIRKKERKCKGKDADIVKEKDGGERGKGGAPS